MEEQLVQRRQYSQATGTEAREVGPIEFVYVDRAVVCTTAQRRACRFVQGFTFGQFEAAQQVVVQCDAEVLGILRDGCALWRHSLLRLEKSARRARLAPRRFGAVRAARLRRGFLRAAGLESFDRHQHVVHFTLHVARRAVTPVAKQPHDFAHRLAGPLIGDAVNHDDSDAIMFAHWRIRIRRECSIQPPRKEMAAKESGDVKLRARMVGAL